MNIPTMREKLRILLTHWVEHNLEHAEEFQRWAGEADKAGETEAASHLNAAAAGMEFVNSNLLAALDAIGGSLEDRR
jgi:hypothetical protein